MSDVLAGELAQRIGEPRRNRASLSAGESPTGRVRPLQTDESGRLLTRLVGPDGQPLGTGSNPLEVKVRELEDKIDELKTTLTDGTAKTQLSGSLPQPAEAIPVSVQGTARTEEVIFPRAVRQSNPSSVRKSAPAGVRGLILLHRIYGVTGTFGEGEGASARATCRYDNAADGPGRSFQAGHAITTLARTHTVFWYPGAVFNAEQDGLVLLGKVTTIGLPLQKWLEFSLAISGTFDTGQGVDSEVTVVWVI